MAELPLIELSYGIEMAQDYRRKRIQMGDGYSVRARDGLNSSPQQWRLTWDNVRNAQAEILRTFFEGLGGVDIIEWTPFNQAVQLKWTATGFTSQPTTFMRSTCSVTLTQEFDL
jgi:phage-related protein